MIFKELLKRLRIKSKIETVFTKGFYHEKKILLITPIILVAIIIAIFAFRHEHVWNEATCTAPKTCECGEVEGEALGHAWVEADCETAKHCSACSETQGDPLGHTWKEADCETAKTCSTCNQTDGNALGHSWVDATCTTAKICDICQKVDGEPLGHKWVAATTEYPKTCETCGQTEGEPLPKQNNKTTSSNSNTSAPEWTSDTGVSKEDWDSFFGGVTSGQHTWTPNYGNGATMDENGNIWDPSIDDETAQKAGDIVVH